MELDEARPFLEDQTDRQYINTDDVFMSDSRDRSRDIADLLKWCYALHLRPHMSAIAHQYCHGCSFDHPSQKEHNVCVMMTFEEQVDMWFNEALTKVDEDLVLGKWFGSIGGLYPPVRYHEISRYIDPEYRIDEWRDEIWKNDVKLKLLSLEFYPY